MMAPVYVKRDSLVVSQKQQKQKQKPEFRQKQKQKQKQRNFCFYLFWNSATKEILQ